MLSSPDIRQVQLSGIASMAENTASEFIVLGLDDIAWLLRLLQPQWNF